MCDNKLLALRDLANMSEEQIKDHIACDYQTDRAELDKYEILIADEECGPWGCDSESYFLIRDKETKILYENYGSHCSCYGFEGQWTPEETTKEYLDSKYYRYRDNSEFLDYIKSL